MRAKFAGAAYLHCLAFVAQQFDEVPPGIAVDDSAPFLQAKVAKLASAGVGTAGDNRSVGVHVKLLRLFYE